jgi:1-acyl-sn-glycerol-3-phosphate acyltransferase
MSYLTSLLFVIYLYGSMVVIGILWLPALLLPRSITLFGIRTWARMARWGMRVFCGATTEVRGTENIPDHPVLLAGKHQSTLDTILPFIYLKDPCIILKKELMWYPFFGLYAAKAGMIPIDRSGSMKTLRKMAKRAKHAVSQGRTLIIFPEGTRHAPGTDPHYKTGIALIYRELGIECIPMALNTGLCWPPKGIQRHPGHMVFEFLPAIAPGLSSKAFMKELSHRLETASNVLLSEGQEAQQQTRQQLT